MVWQPSAQALQCLYDCIMRLSPCLLCLCLYITLPLPDSFPIKLPSFLSRVLYGGLVEAHSRERCCVAVPENSSNRKRTSTIPIIVTYVLPARD